LVFVVRKSGKNAITHTHRGCTEWLFLKLPLMEIA